MTNQVYAEGETRPVGQEVVVFYRETYSVRLFQSVSALKSYLPTLLTAKRPCVFADEAALLRAFTLTQLRSHLGELTTRPARPGFDARDRAPPCPPHDQSSAASVASALWEVLQVVGDRVLGNPGARKARLEDVFKFDVAALTSADGRQAWASLPKQARQILTEVTTLAEDKVTESRAGEIMRGLVSRGVLKTKQVPMRVWAFYMPTIAEMGFVDYPGRRSRRDQAGEEAEPELLEAAE